MLTWWTNRSADADRVQDDDLVQEPPETPAPVFAARALKSAIFGTPAPLVEDTTIEIKTEAQGITDKDNRTTQSYNMSPTKPQGILLTPGTATVRRKTVSFGADVSSKTDKKENRESKPTDGENQALPQRDRASSKVQRKTPLTKSLELVRETRAGKRGVERKAMTRPQPLIHLDQNKNGVGETADERPSSADSSTSQTSNQDLLLQLVAGTEPEGDMTMDLNEPHSQSGKYWKSEFDQYHGQAKTEMEKLLRYKQLTKSYAKKKDAETIVLAEKLKEEQRRSMSLEDKISKLSPQLNASGIKEENDGSPDLVKELAKQTTLARQYKAQLEELQAKAKRAQDQQGDQGHESLSQDMKDLRNELSSERKAISKLRAENAKLTQELFDANLRLEEQEGRSERRQEATEEQLRKKSESYKTLQRDYDSLKEKAKTQRGDAEHLLKKKHDQIVVLRKELSSLRRLQVPANTSPQEQIRSEDRDVIRPPKTDVVLPDLPVQMSSPPKRGAELRRAPEKIPNSHVERSHVRDLEILVPSNRLSSMGGTRTRAALPPERVAAARARLEKKNAEKRKAQQLGWNKENVEN